MSLRMSLQHEEGVHAKVCLTQNNFYVLFTDAAVTYTKICRHSSWQTRYINYGHESLCHALSILEPFDCPAVLSWQRWTGINGTIHWRCQMQGQSLPCRCQKNSRNIQTARANYPWYMGWSDVTYLWSVVAMRSPFCWSARRTVCGQMVKICRVIRIKLNQLV